MDLLEKIKKEPEIISFQETIEFIEQKFEFNPVAFKNGDLLNEKNQNNGSCKIFSFAQKNKLTKEQTLHLFGDYYRKDVLENPAGADHQNIRNFIKSGWEGIVFLGEALHEK